MISVLENLTSFVHMTRKLSRAKFAVRTKIIVFNEKNIRNVGDDHSQIGDNKNDPSAKGL